MRANIVLGTAQFGFDYGINNKRGKISKKEVFKILNYAKNNDIDSLDTAASYGQSEEVIGKFIKQRKKSFKIISKITFSGDPKIDVNLEKSLNKLGVKQLEGYLIHDFKFYLKKPEILKTLKKYKTKGLIKKIGFSLYYPKELEYLLTNNIRFDIIQVPYNIFDQRFEPYFSQLKKRHIEIHVRSVFLQGLVFKNLSKLAPRFKKIKLKLEYLNKIARDLDISISALCLNFAFLNTNIDKIIIGVDTLGNLKDNLKALKYRAKVKEIYKNLKILKENDEKIILPFNWI